MSRLNYMSDVELAILTIGEELNCLERHVAARGLFDEYDTKALVDCLQRLAVLVSLQQNPEAPDWDTSNEPLPPWLKRKGEDEDTAAEPVSQKA